MTHGTRWKRRLLEGVEAAHPLETPRVAHRLAIGNDLVILRTQLLALLERPGSEGMRPELEALIPVLASLAHDAYSRADDELSFRAFGPSLDLVLARLAASPVAIATIADPIRERLATLRTGLQ